MDVLPLSREQPILLRGGKIPASVQAFVRLGGRWGQCCLRGAALEEPGLAGDIAKLNRAIVGRRKHRVVRDRVQFRKSLIHNSVVSTNVGADRQHRVRLLRWKADIDAGVSRYSRTVPALIAGQTRVVV